MERINRIKSQALDVVGIGIIGAGITMASEATQTDDHRYAYIAGGELAMGLAVLSRKLVTREVLLRRAKRLEADFGMNWGALRINLADATRLLSIYLTTNPEIQSEPAKWFVHSDSNVSERFARAMMNVNGLINEANASDFLEAKPVRNISKAGRPLESYTVKLTPTNRFKGWIMRTEEIMITKTGSRRVKGGKVILEKPPKAA